MLNRFINSIYTISLITALFLAVAVFTFFLRIHDKSSFVMPTVINKNFINVYTSLESLGLRIVISQRAYNDLPSGYILGQSINPGSLAQSKDKLVLLVNQPQVSLRMPDLSYTKLAQAKRVLSNLIKKNRTYSLKVHSVTRIASRKQPHNTVIDQYPPKNTLINNNTGIYLLIAVKPSSTKVGLHDNNTFIKASQQRQWVGQSAVLAAKIFSMNNIKYRYNSLKKPPQLQKNGQIYSVLRKKEKGQTIYLLNAYHQSSEFNYYTSIEKVSFKLDTNNIRKYCLNYPMLVEQFPLNPENKIDSKKAVTLYRGDISSKQKKFHLLFHREGSQRIQASCNTIIVYEEDFIPTYLISHTSYFKKILRGIN